VCCSPVQGSHNSRHHQRARSPCRRDRTFLGDFVAPLRGSERGWRRDADSDRRVRGNWRLTKAPNVGFNVATAVATSCLVPTHPVVVARGRLDDRGARALAFIRLPHPAQCYITEGDRPTRRPGGHRSEAPQPVVG